MCPSAGAFAPPLISKIAKPLEESIDRDQISSPVMCVTLGNSTKGEGLGVSETRAELICFTALNSLGMKIRTPMID